MRLSNHAYRGHKGQFMIERASGFLAECVVPATVQKRDQPNGTVMGFEPAACLPRIRESTA